MSANPSTDPSERERVRSEFFRLVLPAHLERTFVDFYRLFDLCDAHHRDFQQAGGFPHMVIDDLLTQDGYAVLLDDVEALEHEAVWDPPARGLPRVSAELYLPVAVRSVLGEMGMETFLAAMHSLTGVARLLPDPDRVEDGVVAVPTGSSLRPSVAPVKHPRLGLFRRIRLLLFVCREWDESWGGQLELRSVARPDWVERVPVRPNRCVVWSTPAHARVAQPDAVAHPAGAPLYCVVATFYTSAPVGQKKSAP